MWALFPSGWARLRSELRSSRNRGSVEMDGAGSATGSGRLGSFGMRSGRERKLRDDSSVAFRMHQCRGLDRSGTSAGRIDWKNVLSSWVARLTSNPSFWKHPFTHDFDRHVNFLSRSVFTTSTGLLKMMPQTSPRSASFPSSRTTKLWIIWRCLMNAVTPSFRLFRSSVSLKNADRRA